MLSPTRPPTVVPPPNDPWGEDVTDPMLLDQSWGPIEGLWFWYADQGSRLIRRELLRHLEQADNARPLASPETWARCRLLARHATPDNPDGHPVGFTRDGDHIGQLVYKGTAVRVDGGAAQLDMNGLLGAFQASINANLDDDAKLDRFDASAGVDGGDDKDAALLINLQQAQAFTTSTNRSSSPTPAAMVGSTPSAASPTKSSG